ncbi:hypothetical protein ACEZDB_32265 [Streptacidiphilus sp. N1-3]|uniref:HD domain-containing protein n=1 Tax=Streptacidiphilus alkalitolerans TaxID=3342712 RepID=A0ABV6XAM0_9ACTN
MNDSNAHRLPLERRQADIDRDVRRLYRLAYAATHLSTRVHHRLMTGDRVRVIAARIRAANTVAARITGRPGVAAHAETAYALLLLRDAAEGVPEVTVELLGIAHDARTEARKPGVDDSTRLNLDDIAYDAREMALNLTYFGLPHQTPYGRAALVLIKKRAAEHGLSQQ